MKLSTSSSSSGSRKPSNDWRGLRRRLSPTRGLHAGPVMSRPRGILWLWSEPQADGRPDVGRRDGDAVVAGRDVVGIDRAQAHRGFAGREVLPYLVRNGD